MERGVACPAVSGSSIWPRYIADFFRDPAAATLNASNFPDTGERGLSRRRLLVGVSGPFLSGVHAKSPKTHLLYSYYAD